MKIMISMIFPKISLGAVGGIRMGIFGLTDWNNIGNIWFTGLE